MQNMGRPIPDILSMIRTLVGHSSISSADPRYDQSNLKVIQILAEWLEALGFRVDLHPVSEQKSNLVATLGDAESRNGLIFSGHTDTVPFDDSLWTLDPFNVTERDNRYYGLGTTDMKSFFALVLDAISRYSKNDLIEPIIVLATADEESTMAGAKLLADKGLKLGRYAVIGEPTDLQPIRMHKGVMMESIIVNGKAGHSSDPGLGANAIEGMHEVLAELLTWRRELQQKHLNSLFKVDIPTLNLGSIHGGDNPNRICSHCETQIDIRPLPGMDLEELRCSLAKRVNTALKSHPKLSFEIKSLFSGVPAFEIPESSVLVKTCEKLTGQASGAVAFGTEAPYLSQLGIETVIMGPGSIDQAHQADEYIPMDQIRPTIKIIRQLVDRFCRNKKSQ